ncbi:cadmium resistance transporter [Eubacterium sp. 1001713B170207_170306_E7]|uniref:cadmium resistance transporter n=1 Tax=Eubacterium sp. 1001713B170207_170306_E7 TaxID=2787097 RepID=UPI00189735C8|nr:cadmium resistance transporter [Eubacterium sp. 1001713B170207_170306_E7]
MSIVITALLSFAGTNIDDILILTLLFSKAGSAADKWRIVLGQYLAVLTLTFFSLFFGYSISFVPHVYIGLFGLIPILLGLRAVWQLRNKENNKKAETEATQENSGSLKQLLTKIFPADILYVYFLTLANGADNVSIYIPLFTNLGTVEIVTIIVIFVILIGVWCFLGIKIGQYPLIRAFLEKYKDVLIPVVFIGLGLYILLKSGTLGLLLG